MLRIDGKKLSDLRKKQAMTQSALAGAAELSRSTICRLESGRGAAESVRSVAAVLGVEASELVLSSSPAKASSRPPASPPTKPVLTSTSPPTKPAPTSPSPSPVPSSSARPTWSLAERCPEPPRTTRAIEISHSLRGPQPLTRNPRHVFCYWPYKPRAAFEIEDFEGVVRAALPERSWAPEHLIPGEFYGEPASVSLSGLGWVEGDPAQSSLAVGVDLSVAVSLRLWESMPRQFVWGPNGIGLTSVVSVLADYLSLVHRLAAASSEAITPMHFAYWLDGVDARRFVYDTSAGQQLSSAFASPPIQQPRLSIGGSFEPANVPTEAPALLQKVAGRLCMLARGRANQGFLEMQIKGALERAGLR